MTVLILVANWSYNGFKHNLVLRLIVSHRTWILVFSPLFCHALLGKFKRVSNIPLLAVNGSDYEWQIDDGTSS